MKRWWIMAMGLLAACPVLASGPAIGRSVQGSGAEAVGAAAAVRPGPTAGDEEPGTTRPAGALLRLEERSHDFGDVARKGGDLVHEFVFVNEGAAPLVLTRVFTSCSCLKTSFAKRPVAPGAKGVIRVTYEPHKSEPGAFNKVIQVYSNSTGGRALLTVQGNSIDR